MQPRHSGPVNTPSLLARLAAVSGGRPGLASQVVSSVSGWLLTTALPRRSDCTGLDHCATGKSCLRLSHFCPSSGQNVPGNWPPGANPCWTACDLRIRRPLQRTGCYEVRPKWASPKRCAALARSGLSDVIVLRRTSGLRQLHQPDGLCGSRRANAPCAAALFDRSASGVTVTN